MNTGTTTSASSNTPMLILAWAFVGIPLLWGVVLTCINASKLFAPPT
jgi:hypothetical protein